MPIKEARIRFAADQTVCRHCGHPSLEGRAYWNGAGPLWIAYCPSCERIQQFARIPGWFLEGLPPPVDALH